MAYFIKDYKGIPTSFHVSTDEFRCLKQRLKEDSFSGMLSYDGIPVVVYPEKVFVRMLPWYKRLWLWLNKW